MSAAARPGAKRRLADGGSGSFARATLARQAAKDAYEFADERPPQTRARRSPTKDAAPVQKQYSSGRRGGAERGGRPRSSSPKSSSPPNPAAKKRRRAAKCLHGVTCYCMIADKPLKERLQSVIKQLGGKLVKKWHDAHNQAASVVVVTTKNVELPPPGKGWRDERFVKATIVSSEWVDQCETQRRKVDAAPFVPEILNASPEELEAQPDGQDEQGRDRYQPGSLERTQQEEREREQEDQVRKQTGRQHDAGGGAARGWQGVQDSSIAGSLGFELTSQASPAPRGAVTSDEEENGGARAVQQQPSPSEGSQDEPLHLVYEETQKQDESDSEGGVVPAAVTVFSSTTSMEQEQTARLGAPPPVADTEAAAARVPHQRRSKVSERMKSMSREIEEEERAEAEAAEAVAIKAAAEAADAAAVEAAEAEAAKAAAAAAEVAAAEPAKAETAKTEAAKAAAAAAEVAAAAQAAAASEAAASEAAASEAAAANPDASGRGSGGFHIDTELQVPAAGARRAGSQSNALDSESLEPENVHGGEKAAASATAAANGIGALAGPAAAEPAGAWVAGEESSFLNTSVSANSAGRSTMATIDDQQEEDTIVPSSQPPESQLSCGCIGETTPTGGPGLGAASPSSSAEPAGSAGAATDADAQSEPARQAAQHGSVDAAQATTDVSVGVAGVVAAENSGSSADHASVLVHDSSDEEDDCNAAEKDKGEAAATGAAANQFQQQASNAVAPTAAAARPAQISRAVCSRKATQRNRRSGQTSVAEDAGWRDPTVRAQLVLRPGQSIEKWSSAPAVVQIRNDITTFGRFESNDVVLSNTVNHQISREGHARIYLPSFTLAKPAPGGGAVTPITGPEIEDGQSRNGIFVNNAKVERAVLRNGDTVTFGGGDDMACGEQLPKELQAGLTLTYTFRMRGLGHQLHILYVAIEGEESSPIGLVRLQGRHTMADLREIISQELDNPPPDGSYVFLHRMAEAAAPVSSKQEAGLAAAAALPLVVLRPL